jgi:dihydrodipicolinate synthase/N-acetylneuraminate lyase
MKTPHLRGYIASALVPYDSKLEINESEYIAHLKEISQADGLCGVYVNAWVGEIYSLTPEERQRLAGELEQAMREAARRFEFERAAQLRDRLKSLRILPLYEESPVVGAGGSRAG